MKMNYLLIVLVLVLTVSASCSRKVVIVKKTPAVHRLPPGQAKKVTGSQSAKPYAPGQKKKKG